MATDDTGRFVLKGCGFGRVSPVGTIPRVRPRRAAGAGRGEQRPGRDRDEKLGDPDQGVVVKAQLIRRRPTASWSAWPTPLRRSARTASSCWNAHRAFGSTTEDLDKRQVGLEGLCQRPQNAWSRAAAHLPALAARRGDPEDRGRTDDGRRLRRRFIGRHHQDHAPQAPRNRLDGSLSMRTTQNRRHHFYTPSGNINIHTGRLDLYASAWADLGKGHGRLGRTHRLHHGRHEPHVPFGNHRTRPQLRRQHRLGIRNKPLAQHRRRVRILAQQRKGPERLLYRLHGRGCRNPHGKPLRHTQHPETTTRRRSITSTNSTRSARHSSCWPTTRAAKRRPATTISSRITSPTTAVDSTYRDNSSSLYDITTATLALDKKFSPAGRCAQASSSPTTTCTTTRSTNT